MAVKSLSVSLGLPFGIGSISGTWEPDENERRAAWEMYVELVTRISVQELGPEEGFLREALTSLYSLFGTTRQILRDHGPEVAQLSKRSELSFGTIAVRVLNEALRPFLATWHPALSYHETARPENVSPIDHERAWEKAPELRAELNELRGTLRGYADLLGKVAGVPSLIERPRTDDSLAQRD